NMRVLSPTESASCFGFENQKISWINARCKTLRQIWRWTTIRPESDISHPSRFEIKDRFSTQIFPESFASIDSQHPGIIGSLAKQHVFRSESDRHANCFFLLDGRIVLHFKFTKSRSAD